MDTFSLHTGLAFLIFIDILDRVRPTELLTGGSQNCTEYITSLVFFLDSYALLSNS